jgi:hypothetical protein
MKQALGATVPRALSSLYPLFSGSNPIKPSFHSADDSLRTQVSITPFQFKEEKVIG